MEQTQEKVLARNLSIPRADPLELNATLDLLEYLKEEVDPVEDEVARSGDAITIRGQSGTPWRK